MLDIVLSDVTSQTIRSKRLQSSILWVGWFLLLLGITAVLGLIMFMWGPSYNVFAWIAFTLCIIGIILVPRFGVYFIIFFGLMGDNVLTPWFPFVKNMSSAESLLYLSDAVILSPMEAFMGITLLSWLGRAFGKKKFTFYAGPLLWPVAAFTLFVLLGFVYGIFSGGDIRIALFEGRAIFYIPIMLILASNLILEENHAKTLMWLIVISLFLEGVSGVYYFFAELEGDISTVQAITEHSAAIHMNTVFIFFLSLWLYKGSLINRLIIPFLVPVVAFAYIATQRRAAFLTLAVAIACMFLILYKENFKLFWLIVPPLAVMGILYLGAFWNSGGALGLPAQAVKAAIVPEQANAADRNSDIYRAIENVNSIFTIHTSPLTGVGFGNKFYMLVPLPDLSFFEFWEYMTHNSILWMWMKSGIGGFFSMLLMIGFTIMTGLKVLFKLPGQDLSAVILTAILYIIMHFLYAYVDMSWDAQSMIYVGTAMGLINSFARAK